MRDIKKKDCFLFRQKIFHQKKNDSNILMIFVLRLILKIINEVRFKQMFINRNNK